MLQGVIPDVVVGSTVAEPVLLERWGVVGEIDGVHSFDLGAHFELI